MWWTPDRTTASASDSSDVATAGWSAKCAVYAFVDEHRVAAADEVEVAVDHRAVPPAAGPDRRAEAA